MEYTILVHEAEEGGFWSEVPALSGCYSQGEPIDETLHNTKEAIEILPDGLKRRSRSGTNRREALHRKGSSGSCGLVILS